MCDVGRELGCLDRDLDRDLFGGCADLDRDLERDLDLGRATALSSSTGFSCKLCTIWAGRVTRIALIY